MKITTRKSPGDIIFFLRDNKIISAHVNSVNTESKLNDTINTKIDDNATPAVAASLIDTKISYTVRIENKLAILGYDFHIVEEKNAFDSREQLIESL